MHLVNVSPGFWLETEYIADPASLSPMYTVPAANELPVFEVVLEKAEDVAQPAAAPIPPSTSSVISTLRAFDTVFLLFRHPPGQADGFSGSSFQPVRPQVGEVPRFGFIPARRRARSPVYGQESSIHRGPERSTPRLSPPDIRSDRPRRILTRGPDRRWPASRTSCGS